MQYARASKRRRCAAEARFRWRFRRGCRVGVARLGSRNREFLVAAEGVCGRGFERARRLGQEAGRRRAQRCWNGGGMPPARAAPGRTGVRVDVAAQQQPRAAAGAKERRGHGDRRCLRERVAPPMAVGRRQPGVDGASATGRPPVTLESNEATGCGKSCSAAAGTAQRTARAGRATEIAGGTLVSVVLARTRRVGRVSFRAIGLLE